MGVVDALRRARSPKAAEMPRIEAELRADPAAGLLRVARFADTLEARLESPDARLAELEALRPAWVAAVESQVDRLRNRPIPLSSTELASFHRLGAALRAICDAYKRAHAELRAAAPEDSQEPAFARALVALARALDAQSRLLVSAGRLRIAMRRDDWDDLCRLAFPLWAAGVLDEPFPGVSPPAAERLTPRSALVVPLLLRLLEPLGLTGAALEHACWVARYAARRAGVRIYVDGLPHVSTSGPSLMVSANHTVRLDTRDAHALILRCRERLAQGASPESLGLRTFLTAAAVDALLAQLATVWGPCHVPTPLVRPPLAQALLALGLPRSLPTDDVLALVDDAVAVEPSLPTDEVEGVPSPYVYGRATGGGFEFGTEASLQVDPKAQRQGDIDALREAVILELMQRIGEPVAWRGHDARRAVFSRHVEGPRLRLGQLVAVLPVRAAPRSPRAGGRRPGSGPSRLLVGRVVTLSQTGAANSREPFGHDVGVEFWPGAPVPAQVRFAATSGHEDAWWFPFASEGVPATLVMRRDRFEGVDQVMVCDASGERVLKVVRLIDRGLDYDRVEVVAPH
jgi:hypothetical protein